MEGINSLYLILFLVSLGFAAFFCSAETAFVSMQKLRLQHLIHSGHPRAEMVARIAEQPEKFLATVLFGINLSETAAAVLGTLLTVAFWGENLGAALAIVLVTLLTLILAEFVPKSLAIRHSEEIALIYARPIEFFAIVFYPVVRLLQRLGIRLAETVNEGDEPRPTLSEEEFRTAIRVGEAEGVVEEKAAEMLHNVLEFSVRPVREVMVPRLEVIAIETGAKLSDFLRLYAQSPLSRYPVFRETMDDVVGILSIKDVLLSQANGTINNDSVLDGLVRPPNLTPATKPISELFLEMREKNCQMSIVIDEFGGTAGIVSLSQLVEEIVGPLGSEMVGVEKEYEVINEYTFQIDGSMRIEEANNEMELELPEGNYETVAGFMLDLLGHIPRAGEQLRYRGMNLAVTEMQGLKIGKVLLTKTKYAAPTD